MYSRDFRCEFIDLVYLFGCYCLTPVTAIAKKVD